MQTVLPLQGFPYRFLSNYRKQLCQKMKRDDQKTFEFSREKGRKLVWMPLNVPDEPSNGVFDTFTFCNRIDTFMEMSVCLVLL